MKLSNNVKLLLIALLCLFAGALATRLVDAYHLRKIYLPSGKWGKVNLVLDQINANYVDAIDAQKFTEDILPLIMQKLDPHSVYLPPQELKDADDVLEGHFEGIGIMFNVPQDTAIVVNIISGGPSERAGLMTGDRILKVDDRVVAGVKMAQDSLVRLMRGPSGTKVRLVVLRDGEEVVFDIVRDKIPVKSVDVAYMVNDTTGYVKLSKFTRTSYSEFVEATNTMRNGGMRKLIFDLRDNSGGYLDQALLLSNEFLDKGQTIVYMEGIHRSRQDFTADGRGSFKDVELVVLIDEGSASSSEIFAGAIQDNDRGTIIGRRSFGKGLVQEPVNFSDNSGIRLTVARYYTPTGRCIQKPYSDGDDESYMLDIYERYKHGEMTDVDSIPKNDSLKFTTPGGKTVYGGGGIIPDIFVPVDTVGVTDLLMKINRQSFQVKFAISLSDKYRKQLREADDMQKLEKALDGMNIEEKFLSYLHDAGIKTPESQWKISRHVVMTQLRALIGRYSPMDDAAFYPIYLRIDNVMDTAVSR